MRQTQYTCDGCQEPLPPDESRAHFRISLDVMPWYETQDEVHEDDDPVIHHSQTLHLCEVCAGEFSPRALMDHFAPKVVKGVDQKLLQILTESPETKP